MAQANPQTARATLPEEMRKRLESLGIAVIRARRSDQHCSVRIDGSSQWIDRLLLDSLVFEHALNQQWDQLTDGQNKVVWMWPGLALCPLVEPARKRDAKQEMRAAILLSESLLEAEQLHRVCDEHQIDFQAAIARIEAGTLIAEAEVDRMATLLDWMRTDVEASRKHQSELHEMSRELADSYEELSLLYKFSTNMTLDQPPAHFLVEACDELREVLGLRWMALQLTSDDPRLNDLSGRLFTSGEGIVRNDVVAIGQRILSEADINDEPRIIEDPGVLGVANLQSVAGDMLIVQLISDEAVLGTLYGGDKLDGEALSSIDAKLCSSLAAGLSIFIENTMLFDDMQDMFMGVLHALTVAIDAKDSYTHGHSERVALMSRLLAEAAGFESQLVERVYLSALVHDVGKIGVPEAVLCKPGRLTREEFEQIKLHPEIGARIIADIRQMQDLVPGVLYHHERWDGKGYPHGLAGEDIPMFGRLICLADAFDAMSSNRTYRQGREHKEVLDEIKQCAGTQFDPKLAALFVNLDFEPFFEMIKTHRLEVGTDRV